jgi:hypothetical protein
MKYQSKDIYGDWDSPHTFCQYQLDDREDGFLCTEKIFDDDTNDPEKHKCPFKEDVATECKMYVYHKNDKNPGAKRDSGRKT